MWRARASVVTLPVRHLERGEQARRAVALVVVGVALDLPGPQRQHRLGPIERLDLGLLVDLEHDRPLGRGEIQAHDVADLRLERRVGAELERLGPVRLEARSPDPAGPSWGSCHVRCAMPAGAPVGRPVGRRLQREGDDPVAVRAAYVGGWPGRGASARPARPASAYRRRHSLTVMTATPSSAATSPIGRPRPSGARSGPGHRPCSLVGARTTAREDGPVGLATDQCWSRCMSHAADRSRTPHHAC